MIPKLHYSNQQLNTLQQAAHQLASCTNELFEKINQQQALTSIIDKIRSSLDLDTIFNTTAIEVRHLLNADRVGVFRFYPESGWNEGEFVAEDVAPEFPSAMAAKVYDHCFGSQFAVYYTQGRVQSVADIYNAGLSDCHIKILEQFQVRANLIVPVLKGEELWGLLCIHQCSHPRHWQLSEIEFVRKIADHFAIALQQAEYSEQLKQQATLLAQAKAQEQALTRQKALVKIANRIRQSLEWEEICQTATVEVRQLLEADRVAIYRFNPNWSGDFLFESVADGWKPLVGLLPTIEDKHLMETQGGRYANNESLAVADIYQAGHADCHVALLESFQARAYAIVPVFQDEKLWGLLAAYQNSRPRHWREDEVELLAQIGEQLSIALRQVREQKQAINRQKALVKIVSNIRHSLDFTSICQTATAEVRQLLEADRVAIYRFLSDWSGDFLFESMAAGCTPLVGVSLIKDTHLMEMQGGRYANNETFAVADIYQVGHSECHIALLEQFQVKAYAIAPIFQDEKLWGLLAAYQNSGPRYWKEDEIELLAQIGEQLGIALQQAESVERIQDQSAQLKQMLEELHQSQIQLIQNEKMASLGQLVAGIAHEINNPVSFIYGNLPYVNDYIMELLKLVRLYQQHEANSNRDIQILQTQAEAVDVDFIFEDLPKLLTSMKVGATRIRDIVISLRNFSRLDESEIKFVDLHEGIDSTLLILGHRMKIGSELVEVQVIKNYGELPRIQCYPAQLNQVFMNLLVNALDAIEEDLNGEKLNREGDRLPKIWIATHLNEQEQVEINIRDNGSGIEQKNLSRIFDRFFTTKDVAKGTGLGLALSWQIIVEKHGGGIAVNSTPNQGTEFKISLPINLPR